MDAVIIFRRQFKYMNDLPFDTTGLATANTDEYLAIYNSLNEKFRIHRTGYIDFHLEDFETFKAFHDYNLRNSFVIKNDCSDCYILFVDTHGRKTSARGKITEEHHYQVWGLAYLKQDFGKIKIRPETLVDKIGEFLHPIELDFKEDKAFSDTFFVLTNDRDKASAGMDRHFRNAVMDIREYDFVIEIVNHTLIIGSRKPVTPEKAVHLAEFINRVVEES